MSTRFAPSSQDFRNNNGIMENIISSGTHKIVRENWKAWKRQCIDGRTGDSKGRNDVPKVFLFFAGLEVNHLAIDWTTVDLSRSMSSVTATEMFRAKVKLYEMKLMFRGEVVIKEEPQQQNGSHDTSQQGITLQPTVAGEGTSRPIGTDAESSQLSDEETRTSNVVETKERRPADEKRKTINARTGSILCPRRKHQQTTSLHLTCDWATLMNFMMTYVATGKLDLVQQYLLNMQAHWEKDQLVKQTLNRHVKGLKDSLHKETTRVGNLDKFIQDSQPSSSPKVTELQKLLLEAEARIQDLEQQVRVHQETSLASEKLPRMNQELIAQLTMLREKSQKEAQDEQHITRKMEEDKTQVSAVAMQQADLAKIWQMLAQE